jgi:exodeoxyribonuclease VII large subunit
MKVTLIDVQVQGEASPAQIVQAIQQFNQMAAPPEVLVVTRGGGSAEDLQSFSTEQVTRAVAASRIPTIVAIGHEVDISLAELAADQRASTPSNAAELLVPDRKAMLASLQAQRERLGNLAERAVHDARHAVKLHKESLANGMQSILSQEKQQLALRKQILTAFDPQAALSRGYALVRKGKVYVTTGTDVSVGDELELQLTDAHLTITVKGITMMEEKSNG